MQFRKAENSDLQEVVRIYDLTHDAEEQGETTTGWIRKIYPTELTARAALARGDLFVETDDNETICGTAIINQLQGDAYKKAPWRFTAEDSEVMVLHTLAISPERKGSGFGTAFLKFYESLALSAGCRYLRIDTNARNTVARAFYRKTGYREIAVVPVDFNGIPGVDLVLLEKRINKHE
ncbi:MAG: GNAT family N-acetyltransferase [Oscillospiraceae bacterium]|nr:GNAT family N-acetyltransferase [Oscillospiraceae bacterium]